MLDMVRGRLAFLLLQPYLSIYMSYLSVIIGTTIRLINLVCVWRWWCHLSTGL